MNRMKKIINMLLLLSACGSLTAQPADDLERAFYYQRYQEAGRLLQQRLLQDPADAAARYGKTQLYLRQGFIDSARILLAQMSLPAAAGDRDGDWLLMARSAVLLASGEAQAAADQIEQVLQASRYKNEALLAAGLGAMAAAPKADWQRALGWLQQAPEKLARRAALQTLAGDLYRRMGEGGKAVRAYEDALADDPGYAEARYKTGLIYKSQQNPEIYLEQFSAAVNADSTYAPALYQLYAHYFTRDVQQAARYLYAYIRHSEPSPEQAYLEMDLQYVSGQTAAALQTARLIRARDGDAVQPRLFKLMAYAEAALGDSAAAVKAMQAYFQRQPDSLRVAKDYVLNIRLLQFQRGDTAAIVDNYRKAIAREENADDKISYMKALADLQRERGNRDREARWREAIVQSKAQPSNLDIYNWGLALFYSRDYDKADSVFALYEEKYPDQVYGYLWRARCNALIDSTMEKGMAVPHYLKLIAVAHQDSVRNRDLLLRAYGYLGVYEANITRQYSASLEYFSKVLELDPANTDAITNAAVLKKLISRQGNGSDMN